MDCPKNHLPANKIIPSSWQAAAKACGRLEPRVAAKFFLRSGINKLLPEDTTPVCRPSRSAPELDDFPAIAF